jgi:hypothetical protein
VYIAIDFVFAGIAYLQFPETRRMTIEEISLMFDYGVKEGRAMVMQKMEHQEQGHKADIEALGTEGDLETGPKHDTEHLERPGPARA